MQDKKYFAVPHLFTHMGHRLTSGCTLKSGITAAWRHNHLNIVAVDDDERAFAACEELKYGCNGWYKLHETPTMSLQKSNYSFILRSYGEYPMSSCIEGL